MTTTEDLIERIRQGTMFGGGTTLVGNEMIDEIAPLLEAYAARDFVTVMTSESATRDFPGVDGFREALSDWISPYEAFRLEIDDVIVRNDRLVFFALQVASTKHQGVEVVTDSASVWWVRDGLISQIVFYLDRRAALKSAGIDPGRRPMD